MKLSSTTKRHIESRLTFDYRLQFLQSGKNVADYFTEFPAMKLPCVVLQEISLMSLTSSTPDEFGILFADLIVKLKDMKSGLVYNDLDPVAIKLLSIVTSAFRESKQYIIPDSRDPKWPWPSVLTCTDVVEYYKVGLDGIHLIVTPNAIEAVILWTSLYHIFNIEFHKSIRKTNQFFDYILYRKTCVDMEAAVKTLIKKLKIV
ncbi:unnamed protein product [Didymodactylos carnosus]|uniref:Uncharacterized protein n=1 Tax=Didymodactylos carnosus TaxID=1234261 RepID=A0A814PFD1_9BILA|nr:unnamed protein product [Didymodactylos carnosus]CAF1290294.1 unnamed protein product [Didymodactylos carnosus]CAF3870108.1 unnamed protein product [Didymodactylos carnosus]CAF4095150.1 unnamed protein product [Didymodactylos carnosus]